MNIAVQALQSCSAPAGARTPPAPSSRTSAPPSKPPPLRAAAVARRHSHMIRPVQVAEAIIVLVILFSLFKVVTVEV